MMAIRLIMAAAIIAAGFALYAATILLHVTSGLLLWWLLTRMKILGA